MYKKLLLVLLITNLFLANSVFSDGCKWKVKDRWVLKQTGKDTSYNKFFAIGIWGVPAYDINKANSENTRYFQRVTKNFNLIYSRAQDVNDLMADKVKMIGTSEFPWTFGRYLNKKTEGIDYYLQKNNIYSGMQKIRSDIQSSELNGLLKMQTQSILNYSHIDSHIWAPIDEPASGYGWCWYPNVLVELYKTIKSQDPNSLVYIDLVGNGRANHFLTEQIYLSGVNNLNLNEERERKKYEEKVVRYVTEEVRKVSGSRTLVNEKIWFDNIKRTVAGYKDCGDIFGINSYRDFFDNPLLTGVTVDAMFSSLGNDKAVWLFFDSNGYAKFPNTSIEYYLKNVKLQIYISIIHGATGVLFWNDTTINNNDNFRVALPLIKELRRYNNIIMLETNKKECSGEIIYIEKIDVYGKKHIIAANTSKTKKCFISHPLIRRKFLLPMEVFIK